MYVIYVYIYFCICICMLFIYIYIIDIHVRCKVYRHIQSNCPGAFSWAFLEFSMAPANSTGLGRWLTASASELPGKSLWPHTQQSEVAIFFLFNSFSLGVPDKGSVQRFRLVPGWFQDVQEVPE